MIRQSYRGMTFIEEFKNERGIKMARVRCACGSETKLSLSRWNTRPVESCLRCSIRKNRIVGPALYRR